MQSDFEFDDDYLSDTDFQPQQLVHANADERGKPRPPLRSRATIDFSGRHSGIGTDNFPPSTNSSHISGSTLRSGLYPSLGGNSFSSKSLGFDSPPNISPHVIALLTEDQLHHNPHYLRLLQKYDIVYEILIRKDLAETHAPQHDPVVPNIYQGVL